MSDITLKCKDCGKEFTFTEGEQKFYEEKSFTNPTRCLECRKARKQQNLVHYSYLQEMNQLEKALLITKKY